MYTKNHYQKFSENQRFHQQNMWPQTHKTILWLRQYFSLVTWAAPTHAQYLFLFLKSEDLFENVWKKNLFGSWFLACDFGVDTLIVLFFAFRCLRNKISIKFQ